MEKIRGIISRLESVPMSFGLWLTTALCIIFVRNSVETVLADRSFPYLHPFHVIHFPVFFLSMLVFLIIILHFFSGTDIVRVSKVCLYGFPVILLPVILDFFTAWTTGKPLSYGYIEENIAKNYFGFFNPFYSVPYVPYSIRLEAVLLILFVYGYIYLKRKNEFLALAGALSAYSAGFFYGAMRGIFINFYIFLAPIVFSVSRFFRILFYGPAPTHAGPARIRGEGVLDDSYLLILELSVAVILVFIWFWRYDKGKCKALLRNFRGTRSLHYMVLCSLGMGLYFSTTRVTDIFIFIKVLSVLAGGFFAFQFAVVVNDIFDVECDKVTGTPRPLITGALDKDEYLKIGFVYLAFGCLFAFFVTDHCLMITLFLVVLSVLYSVPPFRLKRFYPISSVIIAIESLLAFILGEVALDKEGLLFSTFGPVWFLVFFVFFMTSSLKDLKDTEGDRAAGVRTLPVMFGEPAARRTIGFSVFLCYLLIPLYLSQSRLFRFSPVFFILSLLFGVVNFLYIRNPKAKEQFVFLMYFAYAFLLFLFL